MKPSQSRVNTLDADFARAVDADGYAVVPDVVSAHDVAVLLTLLRPLLAAPDAAERGGVRHVLQRVPAVGVIVQSGAMRRAAETILGPDCFAVRAILFDKSHSANWKVAWHQDLTIATRERRDVEGFGPWSVKDGVAHVQPPTVILERMITVRLHLDDCGSNNGPLLVLPRSHRHGRLSPQAITDWKKRTVAVECIVERGGLVVMRPLLLHASLAAAQATHRRVLHVEYAATDLPNGLEWFDRS